ncbi:unnamed protein product [Phytomonas sp. Hart1]|nr:unnamed protein product [Phytomonas sp. Hart1]|eukprot:CCW71926.1 unnamed protein product [Phytomonas sp. isolate Hart1]
MRVPVTPLVEGVDIRNLYDIDHVVPIGKGSFSEVVEARHVPTGVIRALKIVQREELNGPKAGIVIHEREILRRTRHPNIITLHETIRTSDQFYFVFDRMDEDLFEFIVRNNRINETLTRRIIHAILSAVVYLHSQSIVHRDIKPENVLINVRYNPHPSRSKSEKKVNETSEAVDIKKKGVNNINPDHLELEIKLTDFGFAKLVMEWDVRNTPCGTSFYIAPEIIRGIEEQGSEPLCTTQTLVKSVDVWSVGVVMYILLSGCPPFYGQVKTSDERRALLKKISHGVLFSSKYGWDKISDESKDLILKMLEQDSVARISAAEALQHPFFTKFMNKNANTKGFPAPLTDDKAGFHSYGMDRVERANPRPSGKSNKSKNSVLGDPVQSSNKSRKPEYDEIFPPDRENVPCMTKNEQERLQEEIAALQEEELLANDKEGDVTAYKRAIPMGKQRPARAAVMNTKMKVGPSALRD